MIALFLLLTVAPGADTDLPVGAVETDLRVEAADADAPVEAANTDAPVEAADTDVPVEAADTDVPVEAANTDVPVEAADADAEPLTWPGWDTFVGPELPDPSETDAPDTETETDALADVPETETETDAPADAPDTETDLPSEGASGAETATGGSEADAEPGAGAGATTPTAPEPAATQPVSSSPPADEPAPPGEPYRLPTYLPFLPTIPLRGWRMGILLALVTGLAWGAARLLDPVRDWLAPTGVLPTLAGATQQVLRVVALFFALGVIAAVIPGNLQPALPWVVLAGAIALGWSAREVTPDFVAGIVLAAERKVRPGQWIGTPNIAGVVEQVTLRVTWLRDATGRRVAVPNRAFLRDAVVTDRGQWPSMEVVLRIPGEPPPSTVRRIIEDAVLVSPWSAPLPPDLVREEQDAGLWRVRARVLEGRFADRFEGALREHVEEVLTTGTGLRAEVSRRSHDEP